MNKICSTSLIFIWIMFLSLQSYYLYSLSLAPFPLLGGILSFAFVFYYWFRHSRVYCDEINFSRVWFFFFFSALLSAIFVSGADSLLLPRILAYPLFLTVGLCYLILRKNYGRMLRDALFLVISCHVLVFWIQVVVYYVTGQYLDLLYPITGEEQRAFGGSYELLGFPLVRATGLFNEPGTFSNFVFPLFVLYKLECADFNNLLVSSVLPSSTIIHSKSRKF